MILSSSVCSVWGAGVKILIEDLYWSVLALKLAKLSSFMKLVRGISVRYRRVSNDVLFQEN